MKPAYVCPMEDYRVLNHCEHGYVMRCRDCGCIRIAFGTAAVTYTEEAFYTFKQTVARVHTTHKENPYAEQKRFYIPTCEASVTLVYSLLELEALTEMLDESHAALEIKKIVGN